MYIFSTAPLTIQLCICGIRYLFIGYGNTDEKGKKRKMMDDVTGENAPKHTHDQDLLDFLYEKLKKVGEPCNNTDGVMETIQQLLLEEEIPSDLIPQPEKRMSLFMEKQGLYPSWVEEISPTELRGRTELRCSDGRVT